MYSLLYLLLLQEDTNEWWLFFGHFHPLVVHLPIGFLVLALLLEAIAFFKKRAVLRDATQISLLLGAIMAILSCIFGYALSLGGGYDKNLLNRHEWLGMGVAAVATGAYLLNRYTHHRLASVPVQKIYIGMQVILLVLLMLTGHYGGSLTHGEGYLTQYLPSPFRWLAGGAPWQANETKKKIVNIESALVYQDIVQPVLQQKCMGCHNQQKQKGGLRMDKPEHLLKGGEHGAVFTAGKAEESELYKRLMLDVTDEHHMPPKGKPQLTEEEIVLLHWWISEGAFFNKKVSELKRDDKIKTALAVITGNAGTRANPTIPSKKVMAPDQQSIAKLVKSGVVVLPVAKDNHFLLVNCVNAPQFSDKEVALLESLQEQIIWLKLGTTQISDSGLKRIAHFPNLTMLYLNHTKVTDAGIAYLPSLKSLVYLNLVDTRVTDKGLPPLAQMKQLKTIYLWQTQVTPAGIAQLKTQVPGAEINAGTVASMNAFVDSAQHASTTRLATK